MSDHWELVPYRIEIKDGSISYWLTAYDFYWVESVGNMELLEAYRKNDEEYKTRR